MGREQTGATRIILERYLDEYRDMPDLTLAKLVYKENPTMQNVESVRTAIRRARGHSGSRSRGFNIYGGKYTKPLTYNTNPFGLPDSKEHVLEVWTLPKANKSILFLSDIHIPFHNIKALELALDYGKKNNVDTIWLNGDILDMFQVSFHEKNPGATTIKEEFDAAEIFLGSLRKHFPKANIYFKEGNHEKRWERWLRIKAPELLGIKEFQLPVILKLAEKKIQWIENETLVKFGKLNVLHGNEFKGGGGVAPARSLYLKAKENCIAGDKHKTDEHTGGTLNGNIAATWSVGCLCELNPEYLPMAHVNWNHGFAHILMDGDDFHVQNIRVWKNRIL